MSVSDLSPISDALSPSDDLIHSVATDWFDECETYWFSFCEPASGLHGEVYVYLHPNMKSVSAGCWMWRGALKHYLQAEHFNFQHYLPFPEIRGSRILIPQVGLTLNIVEPLRTVEVEYEQAETSTRVNFTATALFPAVPRMRRAQAADWRQDPSAVADPSMNTRSAALTSGGKHFDQAMRVVGEIALNGKTYALDCNTMRDKSWGERRPETAMIARPPTCWAVGVSQDGQTAFNFAATDDPGSGVDWAGAYDLPPEACFREGWIHTAGKLRYIVSGSKTTRRNASNLNCPISIECTMLDQFGETHVIRGAVGASLQWSPWSTIFVRYCQVRWEFGDGGIGHGDAQEYCWGDYIGRVLKRA